MRIIKITALPCVNSGTHRFQCIHSSKVGNGETRREVESRYKYAGISGSAFLPVCLSASLFVCLSLCLSVSSFCRSCQLFTTHLDTMFSFLLAQDLEGFLLQKKKLDDEQQIIKDRKAKKKADARVLKDDVAITQETMRIMRQVSFWLLLLSHLSITVL